MRGWFNPFAAMISSSWKQCMTWDWIWDNSNRSTHVICIFKLLCWLNLLTTLAPGYCHKYLTPPTLMHQRDCSKLVCGITMAEDPPPDETELAIMDQNPLQLVCRITYQHQLNNPLGEWTQNYQATRKWHWCLSPLGSLLNQTPMEQRPRAAILTKTQWTQLTFSLTVPTNQAYNGPPVTPYDTYQRIVPLPVPLLASAPLSPIPTMHHRTLIEQFHVTLKPWQKATVWSHQKTSTDQPPVTGY